MYLIVYIVYPNFFVGRLTIFLVRNILVRMENGMNFTEALCEWRLGVDTWRMKHPLKFLSNLNTAAGTQNTARITLTLILTITLTLT